MPPQGNDSIGRRKVVWGFGQLLPHIKRTIDMSRFIPTKDKDNIFQTIEKTYHQLEDAVKREFGDIPLTPQQEREWRERINKIRKGMNLDSMRH